MRRRGCHSSLEASRNREIVERVLGKIMRRELAQAFQTWLATAEHVRRVDANGDEAAVLADSLECIGAWIAEWEAEWRSRPHCAVM